MFVGKRIAAIISLIFISIFATCQNNSENQYIGSWRLVSNAELVATLRIEAGLKGELIQKVEGDVTENDIFEKDSLNLVDDILIIDHSKSDINVPYKMLLVPWNRDKIKGLMGSVFLYKDGKIIETMSVQFMESKAYE